ncbi:MAG: hypothetical protein QXM96_02840 [Candidatus Woesearchaeota archaeon]
MLNSCTSNNSSSSGKNINWRTGTDALIMNFNKDNPPTEAISTQNLNVVVEFSNKGAYNINDLKFYLTGYDPNILFESSVQTSNPISLEGKSLYVPQGSQTEFITWKTKINSPKNTDSFKQDLTVTACYHYKTIANPTLCIEPQTYSNANQKCKFIVQDLGSSQGAPIVINSINPKTTDDTVYLEIQFSNKGKGSVFSGNNNNCYNSVDIRDIDSINYIKVTSSGTSFKCKPEGKIKLDNGNGFAICEAPIKTNSYYITPINIELDYSYRQTISKTLTIINMK